ncbi:hypothetical protein [Sanyastnella coralliicola]|uniref:hypothetical protein n=1 Tax=Sanyastnella coralliicola TaxID=3069118 RepID=UPI0027B9F7F0|nr:hypothetical protein [Longitalea sp. SCSIO 12813]
MSIEVEEGIPINSWWVKGFIDIAQAWEGIASENQVDIEGRVNAYEVRFNLSIENFVISGLRKQANIQSGLNTKSSPYSEVVEISSKFIDSPARQLWLFERSFANRLRFFLNRKSHMMIENHMYWTNEYNSESEQAIRKLMQTFKVDYLSIRKGQLSLRLLSMPSTFEQVQAVLNACQIINGSNQ